MERTERVRAMEARLNRLLRWQEELSRLLEELPQAREDEECLSDYLESPEWQADFEADERGELPGDLPRGVLSEDGIYDALETQRELLDALRNETE